MILKALSPIRLANETKNEPAKTASKGDIFNCSDADGAQFLAQGVAADLTQADILANPAAALELAEQAETLAKKAE